MEVFFRIKNVIRDLLPPFLINGYHFLLAFFSAFIYRFPSYSKKIKVVGVTGTNGKTTTVKMISDILEKAGFSVAYLSSMKFKVADNEKENRLRMTMPGRFEVQKFLKQSLDNGCQYAILEVTSEGIKQHRHRFIKFNSAVFTNLSPEHIESHGSFSNYRREKGKLFKATKNLHILNLDDKNIGYFMGFFAQKKYGFAINSRFEKKDSSFRAVKADRISLSREKTIFFVDNEEINLKLLGLFNVYNALAAISFALSQEIDLKTCRKALENIKNIDGRMETIISRPFNVLVDYAFTPNALQKVYRAIRESLKPKNLICVLGAAGGGRDKWKRPVLGKIAAEYCDSVIVTNEDPYDEDPMEIIDQVAKGAHFKAEKILDRRKAIRMSLKEARRGDVVVITGKGSEPSICVKEGKKMPWDDRRVVREEFKKLEIKNEGL